MGNCQSQSKSESNQNITNAGCLFTDNRHVLAGFQPHKKEKIISGFGGKGEEGETSIQTAWRETLEELFEFPSDVIGGLVEEIGLKIKYFKTFTNGNYTVFVYTFQQLFEILCMIEEKELQSPLYDTFPTELFELILYRKPKLTSEVQQITLLPAAMHILDPYFVRDISIYSELYNL
jgi:hypothetical protein